MDKMNFDEMKKKVLGELIDERGTEEKERWNKLPFVVKMMAKEITPVILGSFADLAMCYSTFRFVFDKIGMNEKTANLILSETIHHISDVFNNELFRQYVRESNLEVCENEYTKNKEKYEELFKYYSIKLNEFIVVEAMKESVKEEKQEKEHGVEIHIVHGGKAN